MTVTKAVLSTLEKRFSWPVVEVAAYNDKFIVHYDISDLSTIFPLPSLSPPSPLPTNPLFLPKPPVVCATSPG